MILSTCVVQLVDIGHYRFHLPEIIGAYENAMVLSTCVVQLVDIGHYRYHLPEKIGAYENAMVFLYLYVCICNDYVLRFQNQNL